MRAVIQRVSSASVTVAGRVTGSIQMGLLVLLAVEDGDTAEDIEWLSGKIVRLRIFNDDDGLMNRSVQEVAGGVLVVSQFTLFASTNMRLATNAPEPLRMPVGLASDEKTLTRYTRTRHIATGSDCWGL